MKGVKMEEVRCVKCNKLVGYIDDKGVCDMPLNSASCDDKDIIFKTQCPRCKQPITIKYKIK
jgi:phage FluMu protein Com